MDDNISPRSISSKSNIRNFYEGRDIFITGVSGFLGKAILEKLLRSCPEVGTVYILIRPKFGVDVQSRLKSVFQSPIFDILKQENSEALKKVKAIPGDITTPQLGISEDDRRLLCQTVSVVIHSAASVKFNEPIKIALNINYHGTERVLNLCNDMQRLAAFVHVSTAYANCDLKHINEEIICPPNLPTGIGEMSDEMAEQNTPLLLGNKPNTYTYTKALAEHLLKDEGGQLPIAIVRPSIISASWQEPSPGYIDSLGGITGAVAATGKGFLVAMNADGKKVSDLIPLDVVANLIIAAAWDIATNRSMDIPVYNCCTGQVNPVTFETIRTAGLASFDEVPYNDVFRYPSLMYTKSTAWFTLINLVFTFIPCFFLDSLASLMGRKTKLMKMYQKLITSLTAYSFFTTHEWSFETKNMFTLQKRLSEVDQRIFFWNIDEMDWIFYMRYYVRGVKRWIFKEDNSNIYAARERMNRMYWVQKAMWIAFFAVVWLYVVRPVISLFTLSKIL